MKILRSSARIYLLFVIVVLALAAATLVFVLKGGRQNPADSGVISGTATLGPSCPVQQYPPKGSCADKPYAATFELVRPGKTNNVLKKFTSDSNGHFSVRVAPGTYVVQPASSSTFPRCASSQPVVVKANETATTNITCDTGIR